LSRYGNIELKIYLNATFVIVSHDVIRDFTLSRLFFILDFSRSLLLLLVWVFSTFLFLCVIDVEDLSLVMCEV